MVILDYHSHYLRYLKWNSLAQFGVMAYHQNWTCSKYRTLAHLFLVLLPRQ
jgi:hypothetical protein